jgi:hypothetical protein
MLQTGSFNLLNYTETSNIKPAIIKFSYLITLLFLDIRLELEAVTHSLFHTNTTDVTDIF